MVLCYHSTMNSTKYRPSWKAKQSMKEFPACQRNWMSTTPLHIIPYKTTSTHLTYISTVSYALACIIFMHIHKTQNYLQSYKFPEFPKVSIWLILVYEIPSVAKWCRVTCLHPLASHRMTNSPLIVTEQPAKNDTACRLDYNVLHYHKPELCHQIHSSNSTPTPEPHFLSHTGRGTWILKKSKGKVILLQAWCDPEGG